MKSRVTLIAILFFCVFADAANRDQDLINRKARERALKQMAEEKNRSNDELSKSFNTVPLGRTSYYLRTVTHTNEAEFEKKEAARLLQCKREGKGCKVDPQTQN